MRHRFLLCLLPLVLLPWGPSLAQESPPLAPVQEQDPAQVLASIDARAAALVTYRFGAQRITERKGTRVEERWRYVTTTGGRFRVDYSGDTQRQIVCDGHVMWDYIPAARKAQRTDLDAIEAMDRKRILGAVLEKVNVPGFRVGVGAAPMTWTWQAPPEGAVPGDLYVQGVDEKGGQISLVLAPEGAYLKRSEIREQGRFVVAVEASGHKEVKPGTFFPTHVEVTAPAEGGQARVRTEISQIVADEQLPDSLFTVSLDPSVSVQRVP